MLELLAISPQDGWAYVRDGHVVRLIRPPYINRANSKVPEAMVAAAILRHGFRAASEEERIHADWAALVRFLNSTVKSSRPDVDEDAALEMLEFAPMDVIERFLVRIEKELIPEQEWEHARNLLMRMTELEVVGADKQTLNRVLSLLRRIHEGSKALANRRLKDLSSADFSVSFPKATAAYGREWMTACAGAIASRGTVLPLDQAA